MDNGENRMNIVSVLGNTNSGCGAVYEYLIGRKDTIDPFEKVEFRLLSDPGGINDLYNVYSNYSLQNFNFRLENLVNLEKLYRPKRNYIQEGMGLNTFPNYKKYWNEYLEKIRGNKYKHRYIFNDIKNNKLSIIAKRIINRMGYRKILFKDYFTGVSKRQFEIHTYEFLNKIISNNLKNFNQLIVLNQCGTFWSPLESTKLIGEPKIITVTRNPFDQYAELKIHKGMRTVEEFINWDLHLKRMESRDQFIDERVLELTFEDFVLDHVKTKKILCNHLGIDSNLISTYSLNESKKNIGKYKELLNNREIAKIRDYLDNLKYKREIDN